MLNLWSIRVTCALLAISACGPDKHMTSSDLASASNSDLTGSLTATNSADIEKIRKVASENSRISRRKNSASKSDDLNDPINLAFIGDRAEVIKAFEDLGWRVADGLNVGNSLHLAFSVLFNSPYPTAPVSNQYLFDRRHDFAIEQEIQPGRQRHHIRFWQVNGDSASDGRPIWLAAATFDTKIILSTHHGLHTTHAVASAVDVERQTLHAALLAAHWVENATELEGIIPQSPKPVKENWRRLENSEDIPMITDGKLVVITLRAAPAYSASATAAQGNPDGEAADAVIDACLTNMSEISEVDVSNASIAKACNVTDWTPPVGNLKSGVNGDIVAVVDTFADASFLGQFERFKIKKDETIYVDWTWMHRRISSMNVRFLDNKYRLRFIAKNGDSFVTSNLGKDANVGITHPGFNDMIVKIKVEPIP